MRRALDNGVREIFASTICVPTAVVELSLHSAMMIELDGLCNLICVQFAQYPFILLVFVYGTTFLSPLLD